jgi:hypothetical protein
MMARRHHSSQAAKKYPQKPANFNKCNAKTGISPSLTPITARVQKWLGVLAAKKHKSRKKRGSQCVYLFRSFLCILSFFTAKPNSVFFPGSRIFEFQVPMFQSTIHLLIDRPIGSHRHGAEFHD